MQIFIGIVLLIAGIGVFMVAGSISDRDGACVASVCMLATTIFILGILIIHIGNPSAMDVYRGKTILQITYKNNVPIDSTVVYK